jgi:hypothetical protein
MISPVDSEQNVQLEKYYRKNNKEIFHSIMHLCWKKLWHKILIEYKILNPNKGKKFAILKNIQTGDGTHWVLYSTDASIISWR